MNHLIKIVIIAVEMNDTVSGVKREEDRVLRSCTISSLGRRGLPRTEIREAVRAGGHLSLTRNQETRVF